MSTTIYVWPDGTWCLPIEIGEYLWKSDDYTTHQVNEVDEDTIDNYVVEKAKIDEWERLEYGYDGPSDTWLTFNWLNTICNMSIMKRTDPATWAAPF